MIGKAAENVEELERKIRSYHPGADTDFVRRVFMFADEAHQRDRRQDGRPYIEHPLAVASILADLKMDTTTIAAGILHDIVEDTDYTVADISKRFGRDTAFLVDSLTKLKKMEFKSREEQQAENFRRMLVSMVEDIRVIIIKFADRYHNMMTLEPLSEERRRRIATETLEIYAPLANRLGIGWLKNEFEELSFRYLWPERYEEIKKKVARQKEEHEEYIRQMVSTAERRLKEAGLPVKVYGRVKHFFGIQQKMLKQGLPFDQIYDVLGLRIITDTPANCYAILGMIHSLWMPVDGKIKDYIAKPKQNNYQSLHTTVIGPEGKRVEFQIRTEEMHRIAEEGIASHWRYKEKSEKGARKMNEKYLSALREQIKSLQEMPDAMTFLAAIKSDVVSEEVHVFTPMGDLKVLPYGSTPVDFAYAIHTQVGHECTGAKVNGRMVPLKHKLKDGDTVEITTSSNHSPSRDWLRFVATQRASSRIKQWLKTEERAQSTELGQRMLEGELKRNHLEQNLLRSDEMLQVAKTYNIQSHDDLIAQVGYGKISPHQVINRLQSLLSKEEEEKKGELEQIEIRPESKSRDHRGIRIKGIDNVLYHTAKCCYPVPGDDLIGFITRGRGVTVHRRNCKSLQQDVMDEERFIDVEWAPAENATTRARLVVETFDKPGVLADLSNAFSSGEINITSVEAATTHDRRARITFSLEVKNSGQLGQVMRKISQMENVLTVRR